MKDATEKDTSVTDTGQVGAAYDDACKISNALRQDQLCINSTRSDIREVSLTGPAFLHNRRCSADTTDIVLFLDPSEFILFLLIYQVFQKHMSLLSSYLFN